MTIDQQVMKEAQDFIDKTNREAGYKKIRNVSHLVEEAIVSFALRQVNEGSPEELLYKVMKIAFEKDDLLKAIFKELLRMPQEEARAKLHRLLGKNEAQAFVKLLEGGV